MLQLGLLCLVQRSKPCQHITLFIRQRCYQISLRLEETLLSNNYRIYIYVLPLRETLKGCVSVRAGLGLLVHCWIETVGSEGDQGVNPPLVSGCWGCEESLGERYNCWNWNFSKADVKGTGLICDCCGHGFMSLLFIYVFYFYFKGVINFCTVPCAKQIGTLGPVPKALLCFWQRGGWDMAWGEFRGAPRNKSQPPMAGLPHIPSINGAFQF